jgi:hypothetical protein
MSKCKVCQLSDDLKAEVNNRIMIGETFQSLSNYLASLNLKISPVSFMRHAEKHIEGYTRRSELPKVKDVPAVSQQAHTVINEGYERISSFDAVEALKNVDLETLLPDADFDLVLTKLQHIHMLLHLKQALLTEHYLNLVLKGELQAVPPELYRNLKITGDLMLSVTGIDLLMNRAAAIEAVLRMGLDPENLQKENASSVC